MSEGFETISVEAETPDLASAVPVEPVSSPVEETQAYVPEAMPAEVEATQINLDAADDALKQNSQQAYLENYAPERAGGSAPITARAIAAKEDEQEEKKSQFFEAMEQQEKARKKELEDNFGMSSKDLTKLLDFISNPELQAKLKDRLVKNGMSKERAEKTMEKMNELKSLKEKEDSGQKLTDEEKARLAKLRKDEDLKIAVQAAQDVRNEMELKTNGAGIKSIGENISNAGAGSKAEALSIKTDASFESYSDSGIKAEAITNQYNMAATATKSEMKAPEIAVAQNNIAQIKTAEIGMASITV